MKTRAEGWGVSRSFWRTFQSACGWIQRDYGVVKFVLQSAIEIPEVQDEVVNLIALASSTSKTAG